MLRLEFFHKALRRKSFHYLLSEACIFIFSIWKSIFLPSQALYYTVELCIKYKIYVLSDIYICKTVFLTAVLNWIKLFVCMMLLLSLIFFLLSWESGRFCCLPRWPLRLLSCQRFSEGINHSLCQRCTANAEHLKTQRYFLPTGFEWVPQSVC